MRHGQDAADVPPAYGLAVLGARNQALFAECQAYWQLVQGPALKVGGFPPHMTVDGWVPSLKGHWVPCKVEHRGRWLEHYHDWRR
jgi:hypothetical protein